jgi:ComF family protein
MRLFSKILDIVFPEYCTVCGKSGSFVCRECLKDIPHAPPTELSWCSARYHYQHSLIRDAIWQLKYKNKRGLGKILGNALHDVVLETLSEKMLFDGTQKPLIIPIPLSPHKLRTRGYNQSALLARALKECDPTFYDLDTRALLKLHDTTAQARTRNKHERMHNIKGTFAVRRPQDIKKRFVLIVDDVTTTGATLREARRVLLSAGARYVYAVTVAH